MWIRSQDRKKLIDVKMINYWDGTKYYEMGKRGHWITLSQYEEQDENVYFGKYATEERCIEIINEIQENIETRIVADELMKSMIDTMTDESDKEAYTERLRKLSCVYVMPEE
jgi:hypothetical protein